MKIFVGIGLVILFFCGCKSYVQVFDTKSTNLKIENEFYIFENDSLKISYSFWHKKGLMFFTILNKLDKPLFIDWKKCSYIDNSVKLNYWTDIEKTETNSYYGSYYYSGSFLLPGYAIGKGAEKSISTTVKDERITFIPPASNYSCSKFYILPISYFKFDTRPEYEEVPRNDNPKKKTKIYKKSYSVENSPLIFRNFLTFSYSEKFENEFYVDNKFYISEVKQMDIRHFEYAKRDDNIKLGKFYLKDEYGNILKFSHFKKECSFYLYIPK